MDVFKSLKMKETVVKIGDFSQAYLAEIKHFDSGEVSAEELKEYKRISLKRLEPMRHLPAPAWTHTNTPEKKTPTLTAYKDYLVHIEEHPAANRNERKNALGWSQWELTRITGDMEKKEFIKGHKISFGKKGSPGTYDEILKPGFDYLCKPYRPLLGKGSFEHRLLQYMISKKVRGSVELRGADVGWIKPNGEKIAIEIELECTEHILTNVKRNLLESGFSREWIVCKNEKLREEINFLLKTRLKPELLEKIDVKLMREIV